MSDCCFGLVVVLVILIVAIGGGALYVRALLRRLAALEGQLPIDQIVPDIGYTSYLPRRLPAMGFDTDLAAFALRACDSAANKHLGGGTQLPPGVAEVGWAGGHALLLRITPDVTPGAAPIFMVAVAGTLTYHDVRKDLRDAHVEFYGAHAHQGFVQEWKQIYPAVRRLAAQNPAAQFIVAGHSLGAAVATLIAAALGVDFPGIGLALYAAATPRTGAQDLIALLDRAAPNHWHIANRADVIPTLPLAVSPITTGPRQGETVLYADFDRVVYFDVQTGSVGGNHYTDAYLCGLGAIPCAAYWTAPPRVAVWPGSPP